MAEYEVDFKNKRVHNLLRQLVEKSKTIGLGMLFPARKLLKVLYRDQV